MKIILLIILFSVQDFKYCKGYEEGYKEGYCYEVVGCVPPPTPVCPPPTPDCIGGYKCGYNKGFSDGSKKRLE